MVLWGTLLVSLCSTQPCLRRGQYYLRDILSELATAGNVSLSPPRTESAPNNKRQRESDTAAQPVYLSSSPNVPRAIAGPRLLSTAAQDPPTQHSRSPNYSLPMYSTELGRLPVYGQFSFSDCHAYPAPAAFNANVDYAAFAPQPPIADAQFSSANIDLSVPGFTTTVQTLHSEPLEWIAQTLRQGPTENGGTHPALSNLDTMPMDNDTMAMWSTAPAGFE